MPQLKLTAQLGLNKTGFDAGIKAAENSVDRFSSKLIRKVENAALAAFGVHSIIQFGKEVINQAVEIDRLANRFNLTTGQVQLLQQESKRTGLQFEELVKDATVLEATLERLRGGEVIFSEKQIEQLNNAHDIIQEFKNQAGIRLAGLFGMEDDATTPDQAAFLERDAARKRKVAEDKKGEKEMLEMEKDIAELREKALPKEERLELLKARRAQAFDELSQMPNVRAAANIKKHLEIEKLNAEIASLTGAGGSGVDLRSIGAGNEGSSLGRIGAFSGGAGEAELVATQQKMSSDIAAIRMALIHNGIVIKDVQ